MESTRTRDLPMSPALAGRLPSTVPPEKSHIYISETSSIFQCLQPVNIYPTAMAFNLLGTHRHLGETNITISTENCAQKKSAYNSTSPVMPAWNSLPCKWINNLSSRPFLGVGTPLNSTHRQELSASTNNQGENGGWLLKIFINMIYHLYPDAPTVITH